MGFFSEIKLLITLDTLVLWVGWFPQ